MRVIEHPSADPAVLVEFLIRAADADVLDIDENLVITAFGYVHFAYDDVLRAHHQSSFHFSHCLPPVLITD
jgi:hypothetical protein